MDKFWQLALGVAGLAAIGTFAFYALYKDWLQLKALATLSQERRYKLFCLFLCLTFLIAISAMVFWYLDRRGDTTASSHSQAEAIKLLNQRYSDGNKKMQEVINSSSNKVAAQKLADEYSNKASRVVQALAETNMIIAHDSLKELLELFKFGNATNLLSPEDRRWFEIHACNGPTADPKFFRALNFDDGKRMDT